MIEVVRACGDRDLVAREDRHAAPGGHRCPSTSTRLRVEPAAVALAAERGDGPRVGEEAAWVLPTPAEQLVQVVGGGRAACGWDALLEVGVVQQAELAVVDQLVLLALAQRLDGQPELLLGLVHRLVVEVGDAGVDAQHGLGDAQLVLAGRRPRSRRRCPGRSRLAACARRPGRWPPRRTCSALRRDRAQLLRCARAAPRSGPTISSNVLAGQGEHGAGGDRPGGDTPRCVLGVDQRLVAEVGRRRPARRATGLVAVLAGADLARPCRGRAGTPRRPGCRLDDHVPGRELPLDEPVGQRSSAPRSSSNAAQQRQLAQLRRG